MPALVNRSVGSLCGTSELDFTTSWPRWAKKSRNALRTWAAFIRGRKLAPPSPQRKRRHQRQRDAAAAAAGLAAAAAVAGRPGSIGAGVARAPAIAARGAGVEPLRHAGPDLLVDPGQVGIDAGVDAAAGAAAGVEARPRQHADHPLAAAEVGEGGAAAVADAALGGAAPGLQLGRVGGHHRGVAVVLDAAVGDVL